MSHFSKAAKGGLSKEVTLVEDLPMTPSVWYAQQVHLCECEQMSSTQILGGQREYTWKALQRACTCLGVLWFVCLLRWPESEEFLEAQHTDGSPVRTN